MKYRRLLTWLVLGGTIFINAPLFADDRMSGIGNPFPPINHNETLYNCNLFAEKIRALEAQIISWEIDLRDSEDRLKQLNEWRNECTTDIFNKRNEIMSINMKIFMPFPFIRNDEREELLRKLSILQEEIEEQEYYLKCVNEDLSLCGPKIAELRMKISGNTTLIKILRGRCSAN